MEISKAQAELRESYLRGGPGAVISGLIWLAAGITAGLSGIPTGFLVLFFGGMLIFPISLLLVRGVFRRPPVSSENPGGRMVVETVFPMIGGLLAAWLLMPHRPEFVFPIAAIAVGAHYFGFRSAYGDPSYWVLAGLMCLLGLTAVFFRQPPAAWVPYWIALIEIIFGIWFTMCSLYDLSVPGHSDPPAPRGGQPERLIEKVDGPDETI